MRMRTWVGAGVAGLLVAPLAVLAVEAKIAAGRDYIEASAAPPVSGRAGPAGGSPVTLAILGDSTGAGLGADTTAETVGGQLLTALARAGHDTTLVGLAVSGARVAGVASQVARLAALKPTGRLVVVVLIGVNDATHLTRLSHVRTGLESELRSLRALGASVVLATCPDVGAARNFAEPLRWVAGWSGRRVAHAEQQAAADVPGVVTVDLAELTGTAFRANPALLSRDLFHPSAAGYALWARVLAPAVLRAAA